MAKQAKEKTLNISPYKNTNGSHNEMPLDSIRMFEIKNIGMSSNVGEDVKNKQKSHVPQVGMENRNKTLWKKNSSAVS